MAIQVWNQRTGLVTVRNFDQGIIDTMGAAPGPVPPGPSQSRTCSILGVPYPDGSTKSVNVYFSQPEPIYRLKLFPFVTVNREDISPALNRWMNVGQLDYRTGVSGTQMVINGVSGFSQYEAKYQAQPFDITYTITMMDRYEVGAQAILSKMLRAFPPIGRLIVFDSLGLNRTYDAYVEGSVTNLQDLTDPVNRVRGYAMTIRVEAELDVADPYTTDAVSGFVLNQIRMK